jgi:hypothetical protein
MSQPIQANANARPSESRDPVRRLAELQEVSRPSPGSLIRIKRAMRSSTSSAGDQFKIIQVSVSVVVNGAITSVDLLRGKSNRVVILAGEQILVARIKGA